MRTLLHKMGTLMGEFRCAVCGYTVGYHSEQCPYNPKNLR